MSFTDENLKRLKNRPWVAQLLSCYTIEALLSRLECAERIALRQAYSGALDKWEQKEVDAWRKSKGTGEAG